MMESLEMQTEMINSSRDAHFWRHTLGFVNSMTLKCAVELGIPDIIHKHGRPVTISDLSAALSIPASRIPQLRRLMDLLVHSVIFSEETNADGEQVYGLTISSNLLVKEKSSSLAPFAALMLDPVILRPWHSLGMWFRAAAPPTAFEVAHGMTVWDATRKVPGFNAVVNEIMASDAGFTTELIVRDCGQVFRGLRTLVDVGGGTGTLARAVAEAFPWLKCTVLEVPHVVAGLEDGENVKFVSGNMFDYVPPADATLLKWVLHDWSDEECVKILKRCKEAIPPKEEGGKVIIVEMVMNTDTAAGHELSQTQFLFDLHIMAHTTGKQRSEAEWRKIFTDAGFKGYKILPVLGLRSVIELYR